MARDLPRVAYFDVNGTVHHGYAGLCDGVEISEEEAQARCAAKRVRVPPLAPLDAAPSASGADPRIDDLVRLVQGLADEMAGLTARLSKAEADGQIARAIWEEMQAKE